jgi:hypothetical protein
VNALARPQVAEFVQDRFVPTYLKVGTFQIVGGQKVGGNVASYFCLPDGGVLHAIPGPVNAATFLSEARWAQDTFKRSLTSGTALATGSVDPEEFRQEVKLAHVERFFARTGGRAMADSLPRGLPRHVGAQQQVNWLLAKNPLAPIDRIYPTVWSEILGERLSGLPVAVR